MLWVVCLVDSKQSSISYTFQPLLTTLPSILLFNQRDSGSLAYLLAQISSSPLTTCTCSACQSSHSNSTLFSWLLQCWKDCLIFSHENSLKDTCSNHIRQKLGLIKIRYIMDVSSKTQLLLSAKPLQFIQPFTWEKHTPARLFSQNEKNRKFCNTH